MSHADAQVGPDGYQYGVRFADGSVRHVWNGATQRMWAENEALRLAKEFAPDLILPVRREPGGEWDTYY